MAVKDWSVTRTVLLKSDLRLAMAVKYWYTIQLGVLNNDLRLNFDLLKNKTLIGPYSIL